MVRWGKIKRAYSKRGRTSYGGRPSYKKKYSRARSVYAPPVTIPRALRGFVRTGGAYALAANPMKALDSKISGSFTDIRGASSLLDAEPSTYVGVAGKSLVQVQSGTNLGMRIGRKLTIKKIELMGTIKWRPGVNYTGDKTSATVSIALVLDKQSNGSVFAVNDVYDVGSSVALSHSLTNVTNEQRFTVLKRWVHTFYARGDPTSALGAMSEADKSISFSKSCTIPVEYSGMAGTIGEVRSNNLSLVAGCDSAPDVGFASFIGDCRIRFLDG